MESPNEHIDDAKLARLLEESRGRAESPLPATDLHPHFAACATCRKQFEELALMDRQLVRQLDRQKTIGPADSGRRQDDCPGAAVWREIAGGLTGPEQTLAYIDHASRCDHCGPLLSGAVGELADLNGQITEAEFKAIATLECANPEWQRRLAQQIAGTSHSAPERESAPWWRWWLAVPRLAIVGASLLVVVGAGSWVVIQRNQPAAAEKLLARAYTQKRTLELRFAGAAYAPLRVSRGPAASFTSRPPALLKAEALIARQLQSHPSDPSWLQAEAQADVLEGKYDAAVEALRRALELEPHSPAILTDLATAYFQRAQQENQKEDFAAAYEYLSQALRLHPDDSVALFNRAIVAEHEFLYHQALDDWTRYLQVDPGSDWVGEARDAAERVRTRLNEHDASHAMPLLSPAQIAVSPGNHNLRSAVDARIEEYLSGAVRSWLPQAYPEKGAADKAAQQSLFFLADLTGEQHGDRWLADLLSGSSAPRFPQAASALSRAVQANEAGEYDVSRQQAHLAEQLFRASGNPAGVLRAQFERTFAAQIERHNDECRQQATASLAESEKHSYSWLQIQLGLEQGVCSFLMGDIGTDERAAGQAMGLALKRGYGALYLRAVLFAADDKLATGNHSAASATVSMGLERYWSAQFPRRRGYSLYDGLAHLANAANRPNLEVAAWREAVALVDSDEELLQRAMAHSWMASAAAAARLPQVAQRQYAEAARLFAAAPLTGASRNDALESEIRSAQLESHLGRFDDAITRLTAIQDQVRPLSNNYLAQIFYSTLGELQLGRHREAEAEQALRPALALAEQSLTTLRSEVERANWSKDAAPAYLALAEAELAQGRSQDALETFEWYLGAPERVAADARPSQSLTDTSAPVPTLAPTSALSAKETVLVFAALPDGGVAIWVYDDRGTHAQWIKPPPENLQALAERFHDLASDPKSEMSALRRDARSLYSALIAPVEPWLAPQRTLVIEADGWLAQVPFEALLDTEGRYLIERGPIVYSLGQDSEARLRNDSTISAELPALVVGSDASSQAEDLVPLPDVTREAAAVASQFKSAQLLEGGEATSVLVKNDLPAAAIFHFAGHSLATPDRAGLLLDKGAAPPRTVNLLDTDTLRRLNLRNLRLAVLSSCSTATSGNAGTSGFNGITGTLLRAGVPHVVASRWAVDSAETRGFVQDFYHNALSGRPVSEAVRLASQRMLANPSTSHPYYWAAFSAYGRP